MDDFTDYHRYSWSAIKPPNSSLRTFLYRLPGYLLLLTVIHLTYTIKFFKEMDAPARILVAVIVSLLTIGLIVVLHLILNQIDRSRGKQLVKYRVDKLGIHVGSRQYPHTSQLNLQYPDDVVREKATKALTHYRKQ